MQEREYALITGASMGIGEELARIFAAEGHDLVLVARSEDKLHQLARELEKSHQVTARVIPADLSDPDAAGEIFAKLDDLGIRPVYLVNNAGFGASGQFATLSLPLQTEMIQTNVGTLVALTHLALQSMLARNKGRILNMASLAGFQAGPGMAVYFATKAFVISFSEGIAEEIRESGVTVTAHCPGPTATRFAGTAKISTSNLFKFGAASPQRVARHAYRSMMRGKTVAVPGIANSCLAQSVRVVPRSLARKFAGWLNQTND